MSEQLKRLRDACAQPLDMPPLPVMQENAGAVAEWFVEHFATLPEQSVGRSASRPEMEALLREPLGEEGQPFAEVFAMFRERVAPYATCVNHPRFVAFVPSAPSFYSVLGDWLCSASNFFAGVWKEAAGPAQVEIVVLDWFKQLVGYPAEARGLLTSGGSEANLTALVVARERLAPAERSAAVLYATEHRHHSIDRAVKVIGLTLDQIRVVPADGEFRFDVNALRDQVERDRAAGRRPWLVFANGGATNTGTVDPLEALAEVCQEERMWFHVDAAYGWPAVLTDAVGGGTGVPPVISGRDRRATGRGVLCGIERADSITLDPHKWLGQTYEAGGLLVRAGAELQRTFALDAEYMRDVAAGEDEINFCDQGLALTRRFRALKIWLSMKVLGLAWFRRLVTHCCTLAEYAAELLRERGFEILCEPRLSIVCFRAVPRPLTPFPRGERGRGEGHEEAIDQFNLELCEEVRRTGRAFLSTTRLRGRIALRFCFINWRTSATDVDEIVRVLTASEAWRVSQS